MTYREKYYRFHNFYVDEKMAELYSSAINKSWFKWLLFYLKDWFLDWAYFDWELNIFFVYGHFLNENCDNWVTFSRDNNTLIGVILYILISWQIPITYLLGLIVSISVWPYIFSRCFVDAIRVKNYALEGLLKFDTIKH